MLDNNKMENAKSIYKLIVDYLDKKNIKCKKHEDKLTVEFSLDFEGTPLCGYSIFVNVEKEYIGALALFNIERERENINDIYVGLAKLNLMLAHGCFCYDIEGDSVVYKMETSFTDSIIAEDVIDYLYSIIMIATIDNYYNFLLFITGRLTLDEFIKEYMS